MFHNSTPRWVDLTLWRIQRSIYKIEFRQPIMLQKMLITILFEDNLKLSFNYVRTVIIHIWIKLISHVDLITWRTKNVHQRETLSSGIIKICASVCAHQLLLSTIGYIHIRFARVEQGARTHVFILVCMCMFIHARTQPRKRRERGTTLELEHVRNGWWARLSSRRTSRFYGTMVLRAHLAPIHHPLTFTGYSCRTR